MADTAIDANHIAAALVDDCVDRNRSLACLTIAQQQLPLTTADRDHGVNDFQAGLQRDRHRSTLHDWRRIAFARFAWQIVKRPTTIQWPTNGIHHPAKKLIADGGVQHGVHSLHPRSCGDSIAGIQQHTTDLVGIQVERVAKMTTSEPKHFVDLDVWQTVHACDPALDFFDGTDFGDRQLPGLRLHRLAKLVSSGFERVQVSGHDRE